MFKIVTSKTFKKAENKINKTLEQAEFYNKQAELLFNLAKSDLEEAISDYFLTCGDEQRLSINRTAYKMQYVVFKGSIYSRAVGGYNGDWKKDKNIPTDVFNYFYNNKKCD